MIQACVYLSKPLLDTERTASASTTAHSKEALAQREQYCAVEDIMVQPALAAAAFYSRTRDDMRMPATSTLRLLESHGDQAGTPKASGRASLGQRRLNMHRASALEGSHRVLCS